MRSNSSRNGAQDAGSAWGSPDSRGGIRSPGSSSGLHETKRTNGALAVVSAGNSTTLSSTSTSGRTSAMIARSAGSAYIAPSISAWYVGRTKVVSCSMVLLRNSGAVAATKSVQNLPASSSAAGPGAARSMSRSSNPSGDSRPRQERSEANTTR